MRRPARRPWLPAIGLLAVGHGGCRWVHVAAESQLDRYESRPYAAALAGSVVEGLVDYQRLGQTLAADLDLYLDAIARFGPTAAAEGAPPDREALAYYLNAYNAIMLRRWLDAGAGDGRTDRTVNVLWFVIDRWRVDGRWMTLDHLEQRVIRGFDEPRIHFALVCGAIDCPPLLQEPFDGARLDQQLEALGRRWFAEPDAVRMDPDTGTLLASRIFLWYRSDFEAMGGLAGLVDRYVAADDPRRSAMDEAIDAGRVRYRDYDWTINALGP